jgi:hypothetical protein
VEYLVPKPSTDTVAYYLDWSKQLEAGDVISTFTLTVASGTVAIQANPENFGYFVRCAISGGANGEIATLNCTVNTVGLQVLTRQIQLAILDTAVAVTPATSTKRTIINMCYQAMGLADYEFNTTNEEYAAALLALDTLQAEWRTNNLDLGYNAPTVVGQSNLADQSGIADDAVNATALALAMRVAPYAGKSMSGEARLAYGQAMSALRARYSVIPNRALQPGTPRGAGQKPYGVWWPYGFTGPTDPAVCS